MPERNDLKLQFGTAAKPTGEPRKEFREQRLHAGDTTAGRNKSPDFSTLSEFLVGTGNVSSLGAVSQLCPLNSVHPCRRLRQTCGLHFPEICASPILLKHCRAEHPA